MKRVDITAYDIEITPAQSGSGHVLATVKDLEGCFAAAKSAATLPAEIEKAIYLHLDEHPEAPAHFLW